MHVWVEIVEDATRIVLGLNGVVLPGGKVRSSRLRAGKTVLLASKRGQTAYTRVVFNELLVSSYSSCSYCGSKEL